MRKQTRRLPAEWEPHAATWMAWPAEKEDWPGKMIAVQLSFVEIIRLLDSEPVKLIVRKAADLKKSERLFEAANVSKERLSFHILPTDRSWTRDFMPFFIHGPEKYPAKDSQTNLVALACGFTGWGKYPNHKLDAVAGETLAAEMGLQVERPEYGAGQRLVLEGGGMDSNGEGILLTTEECLLDQKIQVRNPGLSRQDYEKLFEVHLGAQKTIWLGRGIAGDDTHGHVDDLCRFVNRDTVLLCQEDDPADANYVPLKENLERLQGSGLQVIPLPMPKPLFWRGIRLPASYANFYIGNDTVLVPTFNDPADRAALGILGELFPERKVVGIHCVDLVWGFGTIHCLTHEEPLPNLADGLD